MSLPYGLFIKKGKLPCSPEHGSFVNNQLFRDKTVREEIVVQRQEKMDFVNIDKTLFKYNPKYKS